MDDSLVMCVLHPGRDLCRKTDSQVAINWTGRQSV